MRRAIEKSTVTLKKTWTPEEMRVSDAAYADLDWTWLKPPSPSQEDAPMPPTPPLTVDVTPKRASAVLGRKLGLAIQKALGMDGRRISHIILDVPANGAVRVTVTEFVSADQAEVVIAAVFDSPIMQGFRARESTTSVQIAGPDAT